MRARRCLLGGCQQLWSGSCLSSVMRRVSGFHSVNAFYRCAGPRAARSAVAVAHALGVAGYLDVNRTAEALALVSCQATLLFSSGARSVTTSVSEPVSMS